MNPLNEVNIEEISTDYSIKLTYHSEKKCQNHDAEIMAQEEADGTVSLKPNHCGPAFEFEHSDPDRVIAIAQMMLAFAQMVKNNNKKTVDTECN